jgi:hypothetical protein
MSPITNQSAEQSQTTALFCILPSLENSTKQAQSESESESHEILAAKVSCSDHVQILSDVQKYFAQAQFETEAKFKSLIGLRDM